MLIAKKEEKHGDQPSASKKSKSADVKSTLKPDLAFIEKQLKKYIESKELPENSLERKVTYFLGIFSFF